MKSGEQLKQDAFKQLTENNPTDYSKLLEFSLKWCSTRFTSFTMEDLENCYFLCGGTEPRTKNIYGKVISELNERKLIFYHGNTKAKKPSSKSRSISVWISRELSLKQQKNRKQDVTLNLFENQ